MAFSNFWRSLSRVFFLLVYVLYFCKKRKNFFLTTKKNLFHKKSKKIKKILTTIFNSFSKFLHKSIILLQFSNLLPNMEPEEAEYHCFTTFLFFPIEYAKDFKLFNWVRLVGLSNQRLIFPSTWNIEILNKPTNQTLTIEIWGKWKNRDAEKYTCPSTFSLGMKGHSSIITTNFYLTKNLELQNKNKWYRNCSKCCTKQNTICSLLI